MTRFSIIDLPLRASRPASSSLPILDAGGAPQRAAAEAEDAGDLVTAEPPHTVLPYCSQDHYDRGGRDGTTRAAVLENAHLRAVFLLEWGGRLWSLVDRATGRDLLHQPEVLQPGNLALRNAWFAGGVEWNLGTTGHWGLTCEPVHAGLVTAPDGTPVLRLWEYERMLGLTWRLDVLLPEDSTQLLVSPVLDNPTAATVPVYWWSNSAVPMTPATRVLAPAREAWHFGYGHTIERVPVGDATSWPDRARESADYFYDVSTSPAPGASAQPWICVLDEAGYGLAQSSTPRLTGRKLFVWGTGAGGRNWQRWLGQDHPYVEIQAGLGRTQHDHLPLPAGARWSWVESYGPVTVRHAHAAGWDEAITAVQHALADRHDPLARAEQVLAEVADHPVEDVLHTGAGWGALEVAAGHRTPDPATPWPREALGEDQQPWLALAEDGRAPAFTAVPVLGAEWERRLSDAAARATNPAASDSATDYHRGLARFAAGDEAGAAELWRRAADTRRHPLLLRSLARAAFSAGDSTEALSLYAEATAAAPTDVDLAIEALTAFCDHDQFDRASTVLAALPATARRLGRVQLLACRTALGQGDLGRVRELLVDRVLVVPDLREGEDSLDSLWAAYCAAVGEDLPLPDHYDFRMQASEVSRS